MWPFNRIIDPTESILKGKYESEKTLGIFDMYMLYIVEREELSKLDNYTLNKKLCESKLIAAGQQFDNDISSRSAIYSAVAIPITIVLSTAFPAYRSFLVSILFIEIVILVLIGVISFIRSNKASHFREYHNFRAKCIEDILNERKKEQHQSPKTVVQIHRKKQHFNSPQNVILWHCKK